MYKDIHVLCQHYLNIVYYDIQVNRAQPYSDKNKVSETDGEILPVGVDTLISLLDLTEQDVFVDLGSGAGKICVQVFLKTAVKESMGVEIVPELHMQAVEAARRIQHELPDFYMGARKLTFLQGDFLQHRTLANATVVLINSTCFTQAMLLALSKKIENARGVRAVVSMRPLPGLQRLRFKKVVRMECSWDSALGYLYA